MSADPFGARQADYYLNEMGRAIPGSRSADFGQLRDAIIDVDPFTRSDVRQTARNVRWVSDIRSEVGDALQRDAECRSIAYPSAGMRDPAARTGCGWWYTADKNPSTGAYGTRRGPMDSTLAKHMGSGRWVWDPAEATMLEALKQSGQIHTCPDIQYSKIPNMGWCPATNMALLTDGAGNPSFPNSPGGDCPGGGIITNPANCPPPPSAIPGAPAPPPGISGLCAPGPGGVLSPGCLQTLVTQSCSPQGVLATALGSGYAGTSDAFSATNSYLSQRGFTIHSGIINDGRVSVSDALSNAAALRQQANAAGTDGSLATAAAANLCFGSPFDPCGSIRASDTAPFPAQCVTQSATAKGWSPQGAQMPANGGMDFWNSMRTWGDLQSYQDLAKQSADATAATDTDLRNQTTAIRNVYGVSVKAPRQGCNVQGVMASRFAMVGPDMSLYPATPGPRTHFLGRYLYKDGMPYVMGSTAEMTPGGGKPLEVQRLTTSFVPNTGGNYQFALSADDYARISLDGQVIAQAQYNSGWSQSQIVPLIAEKPVTLTLDFLNLVGAWTFGVMVSVNGGSWAPIPAAQLYLVSDRRLPAVELAFHQMTPRTDAPNTLVPQVDNGGTFQSLGRWNAPIGTLNGRTCMLVNSPRAPQVQGSGTPSGVFNYNGLVQGMRLRALKSFTMMIQINSVNFPGGVTPSLFSLFNLPESQTTGYPRNGWNPNFVQPYANRTGDFSLTTNGSVLYHFGKQPAGFVSGGWSAYPTNQWFHLAFVWDDDFTGYTVYLNGKQSARSFIEPYAEDLVFEQLRVGCDNHTEGQWWSGGIAWFRGFDYRLGTDLILADMADNWSDIASS